MIKTLGISEKTRGPPINFLNQITLLKSCLIKQPRVPAQILNFLFIVIVIWKVIGLTKINECSILNSFVQTSANKITACFK